MYMKTSSSVSELREPQDGAYGKSVVMSYR
jgi:hypothetical protein